MTTIFVSCPINGDNQCSPTLAHWSHNTRRIVTDMQLNIMICKHKLQTELRSRTQTTRNGCTLGLRNITCDVDPHRRVSASSGGR